MIQFIFRNVLVKGGDLPNCSDAVDVLFDGMVCLIVLLTLCANGQWRIYLPY